jgi:hypothetical protein
MNNTVLVLLGGLIPLLTGFIWYSDRAFGKAWKKEIGFVDTGEPPQGMLKLFLLSYLFGTMAMMFMPSLVVHQYHIGSTLLGSEGFGVEGSALQQYYHEFMTTYGSKYRTFGHGALHGVITAIFFVLPLIGINALFENKSFKYIFIHIGYWALTLAMLGGIACQFYQLKM